jgi:metal-responsive CopG/Arc/MetJ family transcriptional regulator
MAAENTTEPAATEAINLRLSRAMLMKVDRIIAEEGLVSRSEVLRRLLVAGLRDHREAS